MKWNDYTYLQYHNVILEGYLQPKAGRTIEATGIAIQDIHRNHSRTILQIHLARKYEYGTFFILLDLN